MRQVRRRDAHEGRPGVDPEADGHARGQHGQRGRVHRVAGRAAPARRRAGSPKRRRPRRNRARRAAGARSRNRGSSRIQARAAPDVELASRSIAATGPVLGHERRMPDDPARARYRPLIRRLPRAGRGPRPPHRSGVPSSPGSPSTNTLMCGRSRGPASTSRSRRPGTDRSSASITAADRLALDLLPARGAREQRDERARQQHRRHRRACQSRTAASTAQISGSVSVIIRQ